METMQQGAPRPLPVVTDDLALRFADTVDDPVGVGVYDHLATYDGLLRWAMTAGLVGEDEAAGMRSRAAARPADADAALARAHALRAALTAALPPDEGFDRAYLRVRPFVADAAAHAEYRGGDGLQRVWPVASRLDGVLWPIARAAEDLISGPDLGRVKRCAGCEWLFVDRSRNRQRRWCDMNDCGRQEKIRRYVEKRRAVRTSA